MLVEKYSSANNYNLKFITSINWWLSIVNIFVNFKKNCYPSQFQLQSKITVHFLSLKCKKSTPNKILISAILQNSCVLIKSLAKKLKLQ